MEREDILIAMNNQQVRLKKIIDETGRNIFDDTVVKNIYRNYPDKEIDKVSKPGQ